MQECFSGFATSSQQAASLQPPSQDDEEPEEQTTQQAPVADAKLLALHSNCAYVRAFVLPGLLLRYAVRPVADVMRYPQVLMPSCCGSQDVCLQLPFV